MKLRELLKTFYAFNPQNQVKIGLPCGTRCLRAVGGPLFCTGERERYTELSFIKVLFFSYSKGKPLAKRVCFFPQQMFYSIHAHKDLRGHTRHHQPSRPAISEKRPQFPLDIAAENARGAMDSSRPQTTVGALLRGMAWMADVGAIVVLGYVAHAWPSNAGIVASGMIAVS